MDKIYISENIIKNLFKNIYFITGTAYAGKSTMIKMLAEKYNGIACKENYHEDLRYLTDVEHQPSLNYFDTMTDWQEFVNRSPEEYSNWIKEATKEISELELVQLIKVGGTDRKVFVDTNISVSLLHKISDYKHVAIMICPQTMSVEKFFDRTDPEKQFLLSVIKESKDPEKSMENFKNCIAEINSKEKYDYFVNSGFFVFERDGSKTLDETLNILENHFEL